MWAPEVEWGEGEVYLALGLKTLHIGQVLIACWIEPTG